MSSLLAFQDLAALFKGHKWLDELAVGAPKKADATRQCTHVRRCATCKAWLQGEHTGRRNPVGRKLAHSTPEEPELDVEEVVDVEGFSFQVLREQDTV